MSFFRGQMAVRPGVKTAAKSGNRRLTDQQRDEIRELFEDVYITRKWQVIRTNFVRGLALGLGTFLGGTVVVAIVVWVLSQTTNVFPWMQSLVEVLRR